MTRPLQIWGKGNIGFITVATLCFSIVMAMAVSNVYKQSHQKSQNNLSAISPQTDEALARQISTTTLSYLEAPASPRFYMIDPTVRVLATTVKAPTFIPLSSINQPLTEVLQLIANCESQNNPLAKNPSSSAKGLLQILDGTWQSFQCEGNVFDPNDNFQCGLKIAQQSGLHHWNASRACWNKLLTVK
jgi:hypothetical protein